MAFNVQTFRTRALTAIVFAAVMIAGLFWNQWSFLILFSIIHFGCWWEYLSLIEKIYSTTFHIYTRLGFMLVGFGLMLLFCREPWMINTFRLDKNVSLPFSLAGFILLALGFFQRNPIRLAAVARAALGVIYISLSWGMMLLLYSYSTIHIHSTALNFPQGTLPVIMIFSIWINDTMAYIVGSFIGKHPLSSISPKKTWEGTVGGILLCVIVVSFVFPLIWLKGYPKEPLLIILAIISLISAVVGTFGDLLESKLKRMAGVKDSGHFMPGHGGFLDRFDSLLLATPFVCLVVSLFVS